MGKIDKFLAKKVEVTIGDENYMIKPFTVEDLPMMTKMGSKDSNISAKATQEAIFKTLKQIDPECTQEQVNEVSIEYLGDIMGAISKANNMDMDEAKQKLLEKQNAQSE